MLDLGIKTDNRIDVMPMPLARLSDSGSDAFAKVFDVANKSFMKNTETYSYKVQKYMPFAESVNDLKSGFFKSQENEIVGNKYDVINSDTTEDNAIDDDKQTKNNNQTENQNEELFEDEKLPENEELLADEVIVENAEVIENKPVLNSTRILEQLENSQKESILSDDEKMLDTRELRKTSEQLLHAKEQAKEMSKYLEDAVKSTQNQDKTNSQIAIKPQSLQSEYTKNANDVLAKIDSVLDIKNISNQTNSNDAPSTLSEVMAELDVDIEVTSVKSDNAPQNNESSFNFNTSSFNDLNSHITKLSLNKAADFTKIINSKMAQEQQVLNQVKDATFNNNLGKGTTSVSIILKPESLGRVNVNLVTQNGVLSAQFTAQNQQAADALNKNIEALKQNLIEQGVKVNEISVKVQETSQSDTFTNNPNSSDDKFEEFKDSFARERNNNSKQTGNLKQNNYYADDEVLSENNDNPSQTTRKLINNDLGIYNNKGRKV